MTTLTSPIRHLSAIRAGEKAPLFVPKMQKLTLRAVAAGLTTDQVATEVGRSVESAKGYRADLIRILDARNGTHAVTLGYEEGLLLIEPTNVRPMLSRQETRVLRYLAAGFTTEETAEAIGRGEETVKTHRATLAKKLGARNASHSVKRAYDTGILKQGWLAQFGAMLAVAA
jgi:DNA-binding CsgD family transcriptional regulator